MLFGMREPSTGSISINGVDPRDMRPDVLRRRVALARDVEIFDGSLGTNIHLERPDISINDVRDAMEAVGLTSGIQSLAEGLDTHLTARGAPLTTGQLRRLMLARALVGRPELLLIDELLDSLSDDEAVEMLNRLKSTFPSMMILIVTNRVRVKESVDRVVKLTR
jgi:ABC-type bacteriocin/lantibiotic exporter with double-glycine peptidase domain